MKVKIIINGNVINKLPVYSQGQFGQKLIFKVLDDNDRVINLSGYTIKLKLRILNDFNEYLLIENVTIEDAQFGLCSYTFKIGDLFLSGSFEGTLEIGDGLALNEINLGYLAISEVADYQTPGEIISGAGNTDDLPEGIVNLYYTDERVDDRVSNLFQDSNSITWSYDDVNNTFTGNVLLTSFTTDNISEGIDKLFFTDQRVDDRVINFIQDGVGINWTYDDINNTFTPQITLNPFSTTDLSEGTNLYYTNERVDDRVSNLFQDGIGISWTYNDTSNTFTGNTTLQPFSTSDLNEGTNLYYTNQRVANLLSNNTQTSWNYDSIGNSLTVTISLNDFSTTDLSEGTNLYFTEDRAQDAVGTILSNEFTYDNIGNTISLNFSNISHNSLQDIGTYTHTQIDGHINNTLNPHIVTLEQARIAGDTLSGNVNAGSNTITGLLTPTNDSDAATKGYVDSLVQGLDWQESVLDKDLTIPPIGPNVGDRYIVGTGGSGDWLGQDNSLTEWNGTEWEFRTLTVGSTTFVEDENRYYRWNGTTWVSFGASLDHGNLVGLGDDDHIQYHTDGRALTWLGTRTTSDLSEGTNLYYTNQRVDDRVSNLLVGGSNVSLTYDNIGNTLTINSTDTNTQLSEEQVQDFAWNVLTGTQTLINVTYDDINNNVDFIVNNDLSLYDNTTTGFISDYTVTQNDVTQYQASLVITESQISNLDKYTQLQVNNLLDNKVDGVGTGKITVSETEPATPQEGDIWIDTTGL